mmetsp:Transcript_32562/g.41639  ORF Transcript_32562/g.41639 Transcript_32562/m.41639 type:complete len:197 (-) Transcript_32562:308-898(-)
MNQGMLLRKFGQPSALVMQRQGQRFYHVFVSGHSFFKGSIVQPKFMTTRLASSNSQNTKSKGTVFEQFWTWTTQKRPHWKESRKEAAVLFCVFGITGSSSVTLVRPFLKETIGLEGSMKDGPWSYRILSVLLVSPIYACVLMTVGTIAGRHAYFAASGKKILSRFLPRQASDQIACGPAKAKAKAKLMAEPKTFKK